MKQEFQMQQVQEPTKRPRMDWQQVVLNGGPPCFAVLDDEDGYYCGRAERWDGHDGEHEFVSLNTLLDRAAAESLKGICVYCGEVQEYESLEQKAGAEGGGIRIAHIRRCEQRPEKMLIAYAEVLRQALIRSRWFVSQQTWQGTPATAKSAESLIKEIDAALASAKG